MQQTMNSYSHKFIFIRRIKLLAVSKNRIQTDIHVSVHYFWVGIVKRNDIRIVIVTNKLLVDLKNPLIVTKNIVQITYLSSISVSHLFKPSPNQLALNGGHLHIFIIECNHNQTIIRRKDIR